MSIRIEAPSAQLEAVVDRRAPDPLIRILVVEDEATIRQLSATVLSRSGFAVDAAEDGAAAWRALNNQNYHLLITDNQMPKISGVELLKQMHAAKMELPVIMATGTLPEKEFNQHPWIKPTATLLKPFTIAELLQTVRDVLRNIRGRA